MGGFKEFVANLFSLKSNKSVTVEMNATNDIEKGFQLELFAVFTVVDFIARILSKCEVQTFKNNKTYKSDEWYSLNYQPNINQNANEFFYELYSKLLFDSEVLIFSVGKELLIADSFNIKTYAVKGFEFDNVCRDTLTFNKVYQIDDVIYCKYCNTNVKALLNSIIGKYSETMQAANESYVLSSGKKGILNIGAIGQNDKNFEEKFKKLINESFKKFFREKNAVLPLYQGFSYTDISTTSEKNTVNKVTDMKTIFEETLTRAAQAYQVPPVIFKGEVANTENAVDLLTATCLNPITDLVSTEFTRKKCTASEIINGEHIKIDTSKIMPIDIFRLAEKIDKLISNGVMCVDEIRDKIGLTPLNTDWSKKHYLTKNYELINKIGDSEGGDNNE